MQTVSVSDSSIARIRALSVLWLSLAFLTSAFAQTTGTITGQVSNAATATFLEGAAQPNIRGQGLLIVYG